MFKGRLNNVKKNCTIGGGWLPLDTERFLIQSYQLNKVHIVQCTNTAVNIIYSGHFLERVFTFF